MTYIIADRVETRLEKQQERLDDLRMLLDHYNLLITFVGALQSDTGASPSIKQTATELYYGQWRDEQ